MALAINKVLLGGYLGVDPELRQTGGGDSVCTFRIATTEKWDGGERTEWHTIVTWRTLADNCARFLTKGAPVFVEGKIQTREWEDKDGSKRWTTEIVARDVQFLPHNRAGGGANATPNAKPGTAAADAGFGNDDIPF